ncbi:MAG: type I methionyl aminopeptidase [Elusimicrobia bacterium]|nr:type I methionyl aminopeptidase [Elusimicrobiota bacterium]
MIIIKSKDEIEAIKKSAKLLKKMCEVLVNFVVPGRRTLDLARIADDFIFSNGAKPAFKEKGFPSSICTSVNDEVVHGVPGDYILQNGDILSIDMGLSLNGFYSDMAVTVPIGEVSSQAMRLIEVTKTALYKGIEKFRPGNHLGDISGAIFNFATKNGFSVVREYTGHGIGLSLHEEPQILNYGTPGDGPELKNGMVFAIEPMITAGSYEVYLDKNGWTARTKDGSLSAHFEHTVALVDDSPQILTQ